MILYVAMSLPETMSDEGYHRTISKAELPPGRMKTVVAGGEAVLLVNVGGEFYGIGAYCTHKRWDLSDGWLHGTKVMCPGHATVWNLKTGKGEKGEEVKGDLADEPLYDVQARNGYLYVKRRVEPAPFAHLSEAQLGFHFNGCA